MKKEIIHTIRDTESKSEFIIDETFCENTYIKIEGLGYFNTESIDEIISTLQYVKNKKKGLLFSKKK